MVTKTTEVDPMIDRYCVHNITKHYIFYSIIYTIWLIYLFNLNKPYFHISLSHLYIYLIWLINKNLLSSISICIFLIYLLYFTKELTIYSTIYSILYSIKYLIMYFTIYFIIFSFIYIIFLQIFFFFFFSLAIKLFFYNKTLL